MTTLGEIFRSLAFIIANVHTTSLAAALVAALELVAISLIRKRYLAVSLRAGPLQVALGGAMTVRVGAGLGSA